MRLEELKKGDRIEIIYGSSIEKAKVLRNYPNKKFIQLKVSYGFLSLFRSVILRSYSDYNFDLIRDE